ncbi:baseplate J/gp47 family protein [Clostridium sp. chh4-2]|uniref:baseplate J/gp47 family protein n=1 Tax=Clostridium sp. chh4-2 TaxID=2067550 RepID=UPI0015E1A5CB|nr:baseplate J/gp47 family protein [Clostridium sp. chh4-2]
MVLTEKGFKRPTYEDLLAAQTARAKELFGEDIDTSGQSALGKFIRINVTDLADCYELLEDIYYARFPSSARGQNLDRLCAFAGVVRDPATEAMLNVRFIGNAGAVIPAAFCVSGGGQTFYVDQDYTVGVDGTVECNARCSESGTAGNLKLGTELSIVNPDADLERVELLGITAYGQERENDTSLRIRFGESIAGSGSATIDAIRGAISRVALVDGVAITENDTEQMVDGRPPHSFECYVLAPESQDQLIGDAIFSKKPLGIKSVGEVEVQVLDEGNKPHVVRFSRTVKRMVYIRAKILTNQFFESNGIGQIKDSLLEYINNLANGGSVYLSSLYGYIHEIHGVVNVQELLVSNNGTNFSSSNILIEDYEVARSAAENIEIEVVE